MFKINIIRHSVLLPLLALLTSLVPSTAYPETLKISGTGSLQATLRALGTAYMREHPGDSIEILPTLGSTGGINALLAGKLDLSVSARRLRERERAAGLKAHALVRTAFVFVTSLPHPRPSLTREQVFGLFGGDIRRWPDGTPVRLILRSQQDSHTTKLLEHYPDLEPLLNAARKRRGVPVTSTDQETLDLAQKRHGAFTTSTLAQLRSEKRGLTVFALEGVAPTLENLASGAYPMAMTIYLVEAPGTGVLGRRFQQFLRSPRTTAILRAEGSLPLPAEEE